MVWLILAIATLDIACISHLIVITWEHKSLLGSVPKIVGIITTLELFHLNNVITGNPLKTFHQENTHNCKNEQFNTTL